MWLIQVEKVRIGLSISHRSKHLLKQYRIIDVAGKGQAMALAESGSEEASWWGLHRLATTNWEGTRAS